MSDVERSTGRSPWLPEMNVLSATAEFPSALEQVSRPLLRLIQHLTGMETSFVTEIDWDGQKQDVLFSLNTGEMQVPEGAQVEWKDSMCRSMFLSGKSQSASLGACIPLTDGARSLGMKSFFAVPILADDTPIGTVCGASREHVELNPAQVRSMELVAEAIQHVLQAERARLVAVARADGAELEVREARSTAEHHASQSERMERLAHTDVLTGLPNRRAFVAGWEDELARSARRGYPIGLLLIDADSFKAVNDRKGHPVGDAVLKAIGDTLLAVANGADLVARLGGDEFALVRTHASDDGLLALAEKIRLVFASAVATLGVDTTLSIGIVGSDDCPRHLMLASGDQALYRAKAGGGGRAELFAGDREALKASAL